MMSSIVEGNSSSDDELHDYFNLPLQSNDDKRTKISEGDPIWSILPSYHMYTGTIQRNLSVPDQDNDIEPPTYERSAPSSLTSTTTASILDDPQTPGNSLLVASGNRDSSSSSLGDIILADENTHSWQETILDNVLKLKNLTDTDNEVSNAMDIKVFFTKDVCKLGEQPEIIDPLIFEYKEGDYLNGYVLIKNESEEPIPFEMLYLLFEGQISIRNQKNATDKSTVVLSKFLEMFDFSASWNEANIDRLLTEDGDPGVCPLLRDSLDNSYCHFGSDRTVHPGRLYKRFFTFKIPKNLLDTECNEHNLPMHVELPPTLGEFGEYNLLKTRFKDFAMMDTSLSYGVLVRFIGRKSKYKVDPNLFSQDDTILVNSKGDEYMILKEVKDNIRIIQKSKKLNFSRKMVFKLLHENLFNRIKEKIDIGRQLVKSIEENNNANALDLAKQISQKELEYAKMKQAYVPRVEAFATEMKNNKLEDINIFTPLMKKSLIGAPKSLGTLRLSTPKTAYLIDYISPLKFRSEPISEETENSWKLKVPLEFEYTYPDTCDPTSKIPVDIKSISAKFVVTTIRSDKYAFPIEFGHDLIFNKSMSNNSFFDQDTFSNNMVKPMKAYSHELVQIFKILGPENFKLEKQFAEDISSIANLKEKTLNLNIGKVNLEDPVSKRVHCYEQVKSISWEPNPQNRVCTKKMNLLIDLTTIALQDVSQPKSKFKAYDEFCLVPNFQSCFLGRWYQVRIQVLLTNNKYIYVKLPVHVSKG